MSNTFTFFYILSLSTHSYLHKIIFIYRTFEQEKNLDRPTLGKKHVENIKEGIIFV